ncbi:hypothetical protein KB1_10360 [Cutibacterium modestum]|uniref:Uncharacterized protein n=1 Tax=Cutibacterium modestum TaxID=2559073 RepID=A0AAD1KQ23_9ACTN|nr:hypothetical protein KB1_10360 [Cutibacterium modestum]
MTLLTRSRSATRHCSTKSRRPTSSSVSRSPTRIDKVSAYPDLSKDDTATIAYKQTLRKTIHDVRVGRNKNIVGKKDKSVVDTLNKEIHKADKVRANAKSTVAQVDTAVDQLRAAYQTALNTPDKTKIRAKCGGKCRAVVIGIH